MTAPRATPPMASDAAMRWMHVIPALLAAWVGFAAISIEPWGLNPDGVSYLDQARAWRSGDVAHAINSYWSPGYPILLAAWQAVTSPLGVPDIPGAHLLNVVIGILFAIAATRVWQRLDATLVASHATRRARLLLWVPLLLVIGIVLGRSATTRPITPDLLLGTMVLVVTGRVLHLLGTADDAPRRWLAVGALVGVTYLVKTPGLPIGIIVVGLGAMLMPGTTPVAVLRRGTLAGLTCLMLVLPWGALLTQADGRLTLGSNATLNRSWSWAGGVQSLTHADWRPVVRAVPPDAYGVHPLWYAPQRFIGEAIDPPTNVTARLRQVVLANLRRSPPIRWHAVIALSVVLVAAASVLGTAARMRRQTLLLALSAAAVMAMYLVVHVEERFYAGTLVMAVLGPMAAALAVPERGRRQAMIGLAALVPILAAKPLLMVQWRPVTGAWASPYHRAVTALREVGVPHGATIAVAGDPFRAHWAREAGVRIGASLELRASNDYWHASATERDAWHRAFRAAGARVVALTHGEYDVTVVPLPEANAP